MRDEVFANLLALIKEKEVFEYAVLEGGKNSSIEKTIRVLEGASLKILLFDLAPHDVTLDLKIEALADTDVEVYIATYSEDQEQKNFNIMIDNMGSNSKSFVKMYGIVADRARISFSGNTKVFKGAKKSKVRQEAKIISFSLEATCIANPRLFIDENDIEASHGATIGSIPDDSLFYLMSRGLSKDEVMMLVASGSFKPILELYQDEGLKNEIENSLSGVIGR